MSGVNKVGLVVIMLGLRYFPPTNDWRGAVMFIILMMGMVMLMYDSGSKS